MSRRCLALILCWIALVSIAARRLAEAEDGGGRRAPLTATVAQPTANLAPSVGKWIKQLDADEFAQREEASRRLTEIGAAAVNDLAQAALQSNAEVSTRAFAILKTFIESNEEALRTTTRAALKGIAAQRSDAERNQDDKMLSRAATATSILGRPFLGVFGGGVDEGAMVADVVEGSPAEKIGLQPGDVVVAFGGVLTPTFQDLIAAVGGKEPGDRAKIEIQRDGETKELEVILGRLQE